jgi:predicted nucleotidyltransferase
MIAIPLENQLTASLFKRAATRDILLLLEKNRYRDFSIRQLHRLFKDRHSLFSVQRAVAELELACLVLCKYSGRKKFVRMNPDYLYEPMDPYWQISQTEYRSPIKGVVDEILRTIHGVRAVILFGSMAHGSADRMSDIDLLVVTEGAGRTELKAARIEGMAVRGELLAERFRVNMIIEEIDDLPDAIEHNMALATAIEQGLVLFGGKELMSRLREIVV